MGCVAGAIFGEEKKCEKIKSLKSLCPIFFLDKSDQLHTGFNPVVWLSQFSMGLSKSDLAKSYSDPI